VGQGQLDINGGFENAAVNPGASYLSLGPDDKQITGWVIGGKGIDYIGYGHDAAGHIHER